MLLVLFALFCAVLLYPQTAGGGASGGAAADTAAGAETGEAAGAGAAGATGAAAPQANGTAASEDAQILLTPFPPEDGDSALTAAPGASFPFVRMVIVLALIVAAIFGLMKFFRRGMTAAYTSDPFLRRAASLSLAPGKTVHVITLDESAFLIGVTDSGINLIGRVENKELVDAMNLHAEEENPLPNRRSFAELLAIFTGGRAARQSRAKRPGAETGPFSGDFEDAAGVIREQRARLSLFKGGKP
jgi:flagellar protein FliO/FliZ